MKQERLKLVSIIAYGILAVVLFFFFLVVTFPLDALKDRLEDEISKSLDVTVSINSLKRHYLIGVVADQIEIRGLTHTGDDAMIVKKITLMPNPFYLLVGKISIGMTIDLNGGRLTGVVQKTGKRYRMMVKTHGLKMDEFKLINSFFNIQSSGALNLEADVLYNQTGIKASSGTISFSSDKIGFAGIIIQTMYGPLEMPPLNFSKFNGNVEMKNGKITLKSVEAVGTELDLKATGTIDIAKRIESSPLKLDVNFKILGELEKKYGLIISQILYNKSEDGFYKLSIGGTFGSPFPVMENMEFEKY